MRQEWHLVYNGAMKLTLHLDDALLHKAGEVTGIINQTELVHTALKALIANAESTTPSSAQVDSANSPVASSAPQATPAAPTSAAGSADSVPPDTKPTGPAAKFFGEYLVFRKLISRDQLTQATELVESRNQRLGDLAVEQGFMTLTQADGLNQKQREVDKPFGELAVEHGLLTQDQLNSLLTLQKEKRIRIGEAIGELAFLEAQTIESAFQDFEALHTNDAEPEIDVQGHALLPRELYGDRLAELLVDSFPKIAMRVTGIQAKVDKGRPVTPNFMWDCSASLILNYENHTKVMLSVNEDLADTILRKLFGDDMAESEFAPEFEDAIGEFLTIVAAAVARSMQDEGMTVKMDKSVVETVAPEQGFAFPLSSPEGNGSIILTPV